MSQRFVLQAPYPARGDQPKAISELIEALDSGKRFITLLGATGTGKTFTMAQVIAQTQRPALILGPNKTLVAQLCSEFKEFFPENAIEYFVSYYDYYQPEAYIANTDTYIEKDSSVNDEIDRLRHSATQAVLEREDSVVVASVSCIYGLGSPDDYKRTNLVFRPGEEVDRDFLLERLIEMQYSRTSNVLTRASFRLQGELLEVYPVDEERIYRVEFFGDEVDQMSILDPLTGEVLARPERVVVYPASHYVTPVDKRQQAIRSIEDELRERLQYFRENEMLLEAQRIEQRTRYDLEMIAELGYCSGVENYSRHLTQRKPGDCPYTLFDYFPEDFIVFVDESHVALGQLRAMLNGDRSRKKNLIEHGFRLPSALDNRPLSFEEFLQKVGQVVFVSATPGKFEKEHSEVVVEQIIRPTGLVDPEIMVRPVSGQVDDLLEEIRQRSARKERVLVTTLTKKMSEDLADYLKQLGVKVEYLHSEVDTLDRVQILRDLRLGVFDVLVGINLLREGLDLPEVSLVAILDADQQGFLRSTTSLIQTIGRAARNVSGQVILYADKITPAMDEAISETSRRREIQLAYNEEHQITPETVRKQVRDILETIGYGQHDRAPRKASEPSERTLEELSESIEKVEKTMLEAASSMQFETAAALRDEWQSLKRAFNRKLESLPVGLQLAYQEQQLLEGKGSKKAPLPRGLGRIPGRS